jgi:hypothetical protein
MMNGFDLMIWNYNKDSDLSPFILLDDSIDTIKDEYNAMTKRLRYGILNASLTCKNLTQSWKNQESQKKSTSVILHNSFSSSNLSHNVDNGNGGSLAVAATAWQWCRQWQRCGGSGGGGSLVATW